MKNILFINAIPKKYSNTARMADELIGNHEYKTIILADFRINTYGFHLPGDELDLIVEAMEKADIVVLESPVYCHNLAGCLRVVMDYFYGYIEVDHFKGRSMFGIYLGTAASDEESSTLHSLFEKRAVRKSLDLNFYLKNKSARLLISLANYLLD